MSYSWPQTNKPDLQTRLYKEYFHSKLNAEPGKNLIALYMKNNTHKKACHRFHQLLFRDISSNLRNHFLFFEFDVANFEDREDLLYYMSQCWLNNNFAQVVRNFGLDTHSMLVLMTKDGNDFSLIKDNASCYEVVYNMIRIVNDTGLSTLCCIPVATQDKVTSVFRFESKDQKMVQPTINSFTKTKTSVPPSFLPLKKVKNDDAIPKVNNVQNTRPTVNDSLRRDESLVFNFSTASPAVEENLVAERKEPETADKNEEVFVAEPQQTNLSTETDQQVEFASEKVLELKVEVAKTENAPQNIYNASEVALQPKEEKPKNMKKVVSVDINNKSIFAELDDAVNASKTTKLAEPFEKVFQTSKSLIVKEKLNNCGNEKDPKQSVCPLNLPLEKPKEVDASKQKSRRADLVNAETESQCSTLSSRVPKKDNGSKKARRKANKQKRRDEAQQDKLNGWTFVKKNKPRKGKSKQ